MSITKDPELKRHIDVARFWACGWHRLMMKRRNVYPRNPKILARRERSYAVYVHWLVFLREVPVAGASGTE
jgi:hypothetical protein